MDRFLGRLKLRKAKSIAVARLDAVVCRATRVMPWKPKRRGRLFDTFIFYNELDLLELRLEELWDVVDVFVLVEATKTHRNNPKPLFFEENKARYEQYLSKIRHIVVPDLPDGANPWPREDFQRDSILRGLHDLRPNDRVMVSDVDEFPPASRAGLLGGYRQLRSDYYLNTVKAEPWFGTRCATGREILGGLTPNTMRKIRKHRPIVKDGGWHFSFVGDPEFIANKLKAFTHAELDTPEYTALDKIAERMASLESEGLTRVDVDGRFPTALRNNLAKYDRFILPPQ